MSENLVTLPHSGLRVPHTDLHVTSTRSMQGTDGEVLVATLRLHNRIVGYVVNDGFGGPTFFQSSDVSFGWRELEAYVATCRNPAGDPVPEERVLDLLVDEYRTTRDVTTATKRNLTPLRLCALLDGLTSRIGTGHARRVTTSAHRALLSSELTRRQPPGDGEWWQMWAATGWEDLTVRPSP